MDNATVQALLSAVRSVLIAIGATLVAKGYLTNENVNAIVGGLLVIGPLLWGIAQKFMSERETKTREVIAVNTGIVVADATAGTTTPVAPALVPALLENVGPRVKLSDNPQVVPTIVPSSQVN